MKKMHPKAIISFTQIVTQQQGHILQWLVTHHDGCALNCGFGETARERAVFICCAINSFEERFMENTGEFKLGGPIPPYKFELKVGQEIKTSRGRFIVTSIGSDGSVVAAPVPFDKEPS